MVKQHMKITKTPDQAPNALIEAFIIILTVLFVIGVFYLVNQAYWRYFSMRMSQHNYLHSKGPNHHGKRLLRGCTRNGKCPNGNFCYNCEGPGATCCCYDFQCQESKEKARAQSDPDSPYIDKHGNVIDDNNNGHHHHGHQHNGHNGGHQHIGHQHDNQNGSGNDGNTTQELQLLQNRIDEINKTINKENQKINERNQKYAHQ